MDRNCFWLTERQFARLKPLLSTDTRGKPRVDDRRVISGIVHVLKSGGRWIDAPDVSRQRPIDDGRIASHLSSIVSATPSNECSVASRTFAASPLVMTGTKTTSSPPYASPQTSAIGYESRP
jgi:Putative transposase of IS4/5 family (DUF4096)